MTSDRPHTPDDGLDPAAALRLVHGQQRDVETRMGLFVPLVMLAWGLAWLIGFGIVWLSQGPGVVPAGPAWTIFIALQVVAGIVSTWLGIRSGRGTRTGDDFGGMIYGIIWVVGSIAIAVLGAGLQFNGLSAELRSIYYPSAFVLFVGIMYLVAGALWRAVPSILLGGILLVVAAVAPFLGVPDHYLFFALAGGGTFLGFGLVAWIRMRRDTRRFAAETRRG